MFDHDFYVQKVIDLCDLRNYSPNTKSNYIKKCEEFLDWCDKHNATPETISADLARDFLLDLIRTKNYAPRTINSYRGFLISFFIYVVSINFDRRILPKQKIVKTSVTKLSKQQVADIINAAPNIKAKALISLLYACGLRCSELVHLKYNDISRGNKSVYVSPSKNKSDRHVPLPDSVIDILTQYWFECGKPKDWLFPGAKEGTHISQTTVAAYIKQACENYGWTGDKITTHTFRGCRATHLYENGVDILRISKFLGHSSIASTVIYISLTITFENTPFYDDIFGGAE